MRIKQALKILRIVLDIYIAFDTCLLLLILLLLLLGQYSTVVKSRGSETRLSGFNYLCLLLAV